MTHKIATRPRRLNLNLSPEVYDLLRQLADSSSTKMANVLLTGLAAYGIAESTNSLCQFGCTLV